MEIRLILTAVFVIFGITTSAHSSNQEDTNTVVRKVNEGIENLRNLFNSIVNDDSERTDAYRRILKQEAGREQQAFDKMKEELRFARQKNVPSPDGNIYEKAAVFKREAGKKKGCVMHARIDVDVPTRVPSKVEEIPAILTKSWTTLEPSNIPENISIEVIDKPSKVRQLLRSNRSKYLMPIHRPNDFHNYDRRQHGTATKNYCEYEGRYVRRGTQKYIPEQDKVVVCRSPDPFWISVYSCRVLLTAPEKYKSCPPGIMKKCINLCTLKPGLSTKSPVGFPEWQQRLKNSSEKFRTETHTSPANVVSRRLKPLTTLEAASRGRKKASTKRVRTTLWDGEWNEEWNNLRFSPVTLSREEAVLRAAGMWLTTAEPTQSTIEDSDDSDPSEGSSTVLRRMAYPTTTLPTMNDMDIAEASPFFFKPLRNTKAAGIQLIESETEASIPDSAEGGDGDFFNNREDDLDYTKQN